MKYKTHLAGGLLVGTLIVKTHPQIDITSAQTMGILALSSFASLLPDIDHKGSYLGRRLKPISAVVSSLTKHRGATHTPMYIFIFTLSIGVISGLFGFKIPEIYLIALFGGIMSHILLDSLTKGGVPMFAPFSNQMISFTSFKTGSFFETIVLIGLMIINILIIGNLVVNNNVTLF